MLAVDTLRFRIFQRHAGCVVFIRRVATRPSICSDSHFSFCLVHQVRSGASARLITQSNPSADSGRTVCDRSGLALLLLWGGRTKTIMGP